MKTYGPIVECPISYDGESTTHRPGNSGPFFCMCCGATDHTVVDD